MDTNVIQLLMCSFRLEKIRKISGHVRFSVFPNTEVPSSPSKKMAYSSRSKSLGQPPLTCINEQCRHHSEHDEHEAYPKGVPAEVLRGEVPPLHRGEVFVDEDDEMDSDDDGGCDQ